MYMIILNIAHLCTYYYIIVNYEQNMRVLFVYIVGKYWNIICIGKLMCTFYKYMLCKIITLTNNVNIIHDNALDCWKNKKQY